MNIEEPIPDESQEGSDTRNGERKEWWKPRLVIMDIRSETLLGGTTGNEGNGVFAFRIVT